MKNLLYFNPDSAIEDADMLGFGDLIYDDGSTEYLSGDPELAMGLERAPMGPPAAPEMQQPQPMQPLVMDLGGQQVEIDPSTGTIQPVRGQAQGMQDPMTGELYEPPGDPLGSQALPAIGAEIGNAVQGYPQPMGQAWEQQMGGQQSPEAGGMPGAPQPQIIDVGGGTLVELDPVKGEMRPAPPGAQPTQPQGMGGRNGMVPVERHGAMDPEMAARQLGNMQTQQQATIDATATARSQEVSLYNDLVLKQMAANEAERTKREQDIAEQQAKMERWQQEQQATLDMGIEQDLVSARGAVGGAFAAIGAALMGAAGNDAGFRMIENSIDRHVRQQVSRRDTKLNMLAQQIGNSQQAIALGKAALYKVAAERTELLAAKTKADVYEAQTPMVIEQLKQKALENFQGAEQISMGRLIEKAPLPPKPPSPEALQKYGELRRERQGNDSITQRMDQTLGLIWSPGQNGQPGHYTNKADVLKEGIQGTGNIEQLIPDLVYSTMGGITAEGRQVRGAAEAMAFAQLRAVQPTGPISNSDIERAVKMGALDTEDGLLLGLERMHTAAEQQLQHDAAQYGPDVVAEYERRRQAAGGMPGAPAQPAASRPATLGELRGGAQQRRQGAPPQPAGGQQSSVLELAPEQRMAQVREDAAVLGAEAGLPPEGIAILVAQAAHESGNGDSQGAAHGNMFGHKLSGRRKGFTAMTTEGEGENERRIRQPFAAYDSIADATADHLSLLQRKYPRAWEALEVGDASGYVAALKDGGYFTANEERYRQAILRHL